MSSRRKLNLKDLTPDEVASLCGCMVRGNPPFFVVEWIACVYIMVDPFVSSHFKLHACAEIRTNCQKPENMLLHRPGQMLVTPPPPSLAVEYKIVVVGNVRDD